ncbi:ALF repeat-containing protein [Streptomyces sp. NPDC060031]|uniref:ALF repeat-containing protein n=1 Tax=Streptomyces sp. NPDC060031 TaxID=3347043 RepID=UPI0036A797D6
MKRRISFTGTPRSGSRRRARERAALLRGAFGVLLPAALSDRTQAVAYWQTGGVGIKEAAERALLGSDADIKKYLEDGPDIEYDDNYIEASRLFATGGLAVSG